MQAHHPTKGLTLLQAVIRARFAKGPTKIDDQSVTRLVSWLLDRGANPHQRGRGSYTWRMGPDNQLKAEEHSALSLVSLARKQYTKKHLCELPWLRDIMHKMLRHDYETATKTSVDTAVVERWEKMYARQDTHDLVVEAIDGSVSAHAVVISTASPVVSAMLSSGMQEARQSQVRVDIPSDSLSLLFDLIYTGGTSQPFSSTVGLPALDLAHRWQISDVVRMLETALAKVLCEENWCEVAVASQLKGLEKLASACRSFAASLSLSKQQIDALPASVRTFVDPSSQQRHPGESPLKRQRVSF
mmetsp:Transcript_12415/g.29238  ORF Transcript_12415/g.29238 Transcript_12415/m.29238 type:complete len:301 (+) Transcript_12415:215-1117(+)